MTSRAMLALEVVVAYTVARAALRREALADVVARLRAVEAVPDSTPPARLARAVTRTLRPLPVDSRCLMCSLVLTRLLARRGISSTLVLGVRPGPEFGAHAWVEHLGRPLLPPADPGFERLLELDDSRPFSHLDRSARPR